MMFLVILLVIAVAGCCLARRRARKRKAQPTEHKLGNVGASSPPQNAGRTWYGKKIPDSWI